MKTNLSFQSIESARTRIPDYVRKTPLVESTALSELSRAPVYLKLEHQQITGSFKIRGASNAVARLTDEQRRSGVVCVSTGNHGRGIAFAARQAGVKATIYMSSLVPDNKVEAIRDLKADIQIIGVSQDEAEKAALEFCKNSGAVYLPPFDHPDIICGQGTLGLEIIEQLPDVKNVLVPLSGGGLVCGVALAIKANLPHCKVNGISMAKGAAMIESLNAGKPVYVEELSTFADSLGGGIGLTNQYTFDLVKNIVDQKQLVSEAQIAAAIRHAYFKERQIIEGGASVGIAAILAEIIQPHGSTVIVLSGCNIDMNIHKAILDGANDLSEL